MLIVSQILSSFKISSISLLALQCSKKLTNPITLTAYSLVTTSQAYIFNVHQITTSSRKFNIFLARTRTIIPLRIHQVKKNHFFLEKGHSPLPDPYFSERGTPCLYSTLHLQTSLLGPPLRLPKIPARSTPL